jgi:hypothetical protein
MYCNYNQFWCSLGWMLGLKKIFAREFLLNHSAAYMGRRQREGKRRGRARADRTPKHKFLSPPRHKSCLRHWQEAAVALTLEIKPILFCKLALKSTYSNVEFQNFSGGNPRPHFNWSTTMLSHRSSFYFLSSVRIIVPVWNCFYINLITRNDIKQVKNSAKVGVSNVIISSASEGAKPPDILTRGFAPDPTWMHQTHLRQYLINRDEYFYPPMFDKVVGYGWTAFDSFNSSNKN